MNIYSSSVAGEAAKFAAHAAAALATDRRRAQRKKLACRASFTLATGETLNGVSADISLSGLGAIVPSHVALQQECAIVLTCFMRGKSHRLSVKGQILACSCSGMNGFRIGVRFNSLDDAMSDTLAQILE